MTEPNGLRTLLTGRGLLESPRWHGDRLYFSDWSAGEVLAVDLAGRSEVIARVRSLPLCTAWLPDGRLLTCPTGGACASRRAAPCSRPSAWIAAVLPALSAARAGPRCSSWSPNGGAWPKPRWCRPVAARSWPSTSRFRERAGHNASAAGPGSRAAPPGPRSGPAARPGRRAPAGSRTHIHHDGTVCKYRRKGRGGGAAVDFPQGPPDSVKASGAPQDPYSLATPSASSGSGCHNVTRT